MSPALGARFAPQQRLHCRLCHRKALQTGLKKCLFSKTTSVAPAPIATLVSSQLAPCQRASNFWERGPLNAQSLAHICARYCLRWLAKDTSIAQRALLNSVSSGALHSALAHRPPCKLVHCHLMASTGHGAVRDSELGCSSVHDRRPRHHYHDATWALLLTARLGHLTSVATQPAVRVQDAAPQLAVVIAMYVGMDGVNRLA